MHIPWTVTAASFDHHVYKRLRLYEAAFVFILKSIVLGVLLSRFMPISLFLRGSLIETIIIILLCSHPTVDLSPSIPVLYSHLWCYDSSTHCVHVNDQSRPINNRKWVLFVIVSSLFILVPLCGVESPIIKVFKVTETSRVQNSDPLFVRKWTVQPVFRIHYQCQVNYKLSDDSQD